MPQARVAVSAEKMRCETSSERLGYEVLKGEFSFFETEDAPPSGPGNFYGEPRFSFMTLNIYK